MVFAIAPVAAVLYAAALVCLLVVPAVVTIMKGHMALFIAGSLTVGLVWFLAAFRLARPFSPWARRFYGPEKLSRARARYGGE